MSELPKGWASAKLGGYIHLRNGFAFKSKDYSEPSNMTVPVIRISDINGTVASDEKANHVPTELAVSEFEIAKGDLLVAMSGATTGKIGVYGGSTPAYQNQRVGNLKLNAPELSDLGFRNHLIKYLSPTILDIAYGGAQPNISASGIESIDVCFPPLAEQKRIVEKLDEVLAQVDTIKARLDGIPDFLKRFRQSVLASAVSGKLTEGFRTRWLSGKIQPILSLQPNAKTRRGVPDNVSIDEDLLKQEIPEQWCVESVARLLKLAVISDVKDGNHGANHPKSAEFVDDGIPFITAAQMNDKGHIDFEGAPKLKGEPLSKIKVGFAEPQDVIYSHKGSVGRVSVTDRECILSPQTTYYRLNQAFVLPRYLAIYLRSQQYKNQVNKVKTQTTRDFISISAQYQMTVLLPLVEEQKEIVRLVDQYFAFADTIETQVKKAQARVDNLTQSILAKAFRGELVEQDPTDEPADKLLERIAEARKEAEALAKAAKKAEAAKKRAAKNAASA
ncbi:restriction endonuclease subunit S [Vibrio agarivorans]|uniref:restriction endonuclease subunit S n=1 Tax=Vibrio agarivorans TaxID=153622 RepID=UPI0025B42B9F|nr:restriction endonuclease subunit S [Vibrio agarivorans]MDN3660372.1 restriction endonuclease subunit S [Vibrio agarivorans]